MNDIENKIQNSPLIHKQNTENTDSEAQQIDNLKIIKRNLDNQDITFNSFKD